MKPTTPLQDNLASCSQVSVLTYLLLSATQSGGMTEARAKELYDEIHGHFSNVQGGVYWSFRDELIHLLTMQDEDFDFMDERDDFPFPWNMN